MILDIDARLLIDGDKTMRVTRSECAFLEAIADGAPATMNRLISAVWGNEETDSSDVGIRTIVFKLRKKLPIHVVWGTGYRLPFPLMIRRAGPAPITIPAEHRAALERLLYSHPDHVAADRVLASMVGG